MQFDMDPVHNDYLAKILTAQVYDVAIETLLNWLPCCRTALDNRLLLKREDMQACFPLSCAGHTTKWPIWPLSYVPVGSLRRPLARCPGCRTRSAQAGMPGSDRYAGYNPAHQDRCRTAAGGQVVLHGDAYDEAQAHADQMAAQQHLTFVHPYDDPEVIAGQGTIGTEILRQCSPLHAGDFCPSGWWWPDSRYRPPM